MKRIFEIFLLSLLPIIALAAPSAGNHLTVAPLTGTAHWIDLGKMPIGECISKGFSALDTNRYVQRVTKLPNQVIGMNLRKGAVVVSISCTEIETTTWVNFSIVGGKNNSQDIQLLLNAIRAKYR